MTTAWDATTALGPMRTPISTDALLQIHVLAPMKIGAEETFS